MAETLLDMEEEINALHARLVKARAIKQGMMKRLQTGRISLQGFAPAGEVVEDAE